MVLHNHVVKIFLIPFFVLLFLQSEAKHIIGGDLSYRCLGQGLYEITMKIYRDCNDPTAAPFDPRAVVTIYRGNNPPYAGVSNLEVPLETPITPIDPDTGNPCLTVPDGICVQEGVYIFVVNLPVADESYHITYQRCCRNNTINNLVQPGQQGATYTLEITADAQQSCNNSPVFNEFPPVVICAGEPVNFDHSASDVEGDSIVYSFCDPLLGGGTRGTPDNPGNPEAPDGVTPNPATPPPYQSVNFVSPPYNAQNPMGGSPRISIDSRTGLITGVPMTLGQFVVGVCVREYRGDTLLSVIRRDFQFNVTTCEPTVVADIQADETIGDQEFVINSCGNNTVDFINESYQIESISEYYWEFDVNNKIETFASRDATVTFPGIGTYQGTLIVNPGTNCSDTAQINVNIYPEINADYTFDYDTCVAGPVAFTDQSFSGSGNITNWEWNFDDGTNSTQRNPLHNYNNPGVKNVRLRVTDINECEDEMVKPIDYFPVPELIIVNPSKFRGCNPQDIFFDNLSTPIDSTYDISWSFGDGNTSGEISPTHTYEDPGLYTINLQIVSPIGCETSIQFPDWITIDESPVADFSFTPDQPSNFEPEVQFIDESEGANTWSWQFDRFGSAFMQNPRFLFPDTGKHEIRLIVTHPSGCRDTVVKMLDVEPQVRFFMPNAFTPNEDANNDVFRGKGVLDGIRNFNLTIWNRWGEMVFQTSDPMEGWNGRRNNSGEYTQSGVYVYLVTFKGPRNERYKLKGFATLIR